MRLYLRSIFVIVLTVWLAACGDITIDTPSDKSVSADKPTQYHLSFINTKSAPSNLKILLNNQDVTSLFSVTATGAVATGDALSQYVFSGKNILSATALGIARKQSIFYYDTDGPTIHILQGSRSTGHVEGYLEDPAGVKSFNIDGVPVALGAGNSFSVDMQNSPFNDFVAEDNFGHQSTTTLARNDREFIPAISARLNKSGLNFLGDVLEEALGKIDFNALTASINPLFSANFIGFFSVSVTVKNFKFDKPTIDLQVLNNNRLRAHVEIPNFSIGVSMGGKTLFLIPWDIGGTISMTKVVFDSDILLDIVNKDLSIDMKNTNVNLQGFHLDLDHIPNILGFEDLLSSITGGIANALMPLFTNVIQSAVIPVVSDFVGQIPVSLTVTTPGNAKLKVNALPTYLDTFSNALTIDLGASISAPSPSANATPTWGSLYTEGDTPTIGATTPNGDPFDIGASISSNLINQALLAAHEAGITTMTLRPDNTPGTDAQGVSVIKSKDDDIQTADLIGLRIKPASAPFIKLLDRNGAMGVLGWYDVTIAFDLKRVGWTDYQQIFSATFNLEVPFELGATDDGFLQLGLEQLPSINVLKTENVGLIKLTPAFINGVIEHFMPLVLPQISAQLKAVPLPRIAGHSIHPKAFWISGTGKNNLSLAGNLVKLTTTAAAPAPKTLLAFSTSSQVVTPGSTVESSSTTTTSPTSLTVQNAEVQVGVGGQNPNVLLGSLESRFRIDNGPWSVWKARTRVDVKQLLGGTHRVEVCSRTVLLKQEQGCPVVQFDTAVKQ